MESMYDKNGLLKPEHAMTESGFIKSIVNNNQDIINNYNNIPDGPVENIYHDREPIEKSFYNNPRKKYSAINKSSQDLKLNKLFFNEFETYYIFFKNEISKGNSFDDYAEMAMVLAEVLVITRTNEEEEKLNKYKDELLDLIAENVYRKFIEKEGIKLAQFFEQMKDTINNYTITIKQYYNYCDYLNLAINARVEDIDCLDIARILQNAKVQLPRTYDESVKYISYRKSVNDHVKQLEQNAKGNLKK